MALGLLNRGRMENIKENCLRPLRSLGIRETTALVAVGSGIYLLIATARMFSRSLH